MRKAFWFIGGGAALTLAGCASYFFLFTPVISPPPLIASQLHLECENKGDTPVATLQVIPEPPKPFESSAYVNLGIDHRSDCTVMRIETANGLNVHVLGSRMVAEKAIAPTDAREPVEDISLVKPIAIGTQFSKYLIDLKGLGKDYWIGISPIPSGVRSSFDGYDHELALQLSKGVWEVDVIPTIGVEITRSGQSKIYVSDTQAGKGVFRKTFSAKIDAVGGWKDLALILVGALVTSGLTLIGGGALALVKGNRQESPSEQQPKPTTKPKTAQKPRAKKTKKASSDQAVSRE